MGYPLPQKGTTQYYDRPGLLAHPPLWVSQWRHGGEGQNADPNLWLMQTLIIVCFCSMILYCKFCKYTVIMTIIYYLKSKSCFKITGYPLPQQRNCLYIWNYQCDIFINASIYMKIFIITIIFPIWVLTPLLSNKFHFH